MGYKYFLISGSVGSMDVIYLTNLLTNLLSESEIEKKQIKILSKEYPKLIFYVFDDVKFKNIWMFRNGILRMHFKPYLTYYPKDVTFFVSDTGQDILFFKTTDPEILNIKKIILKKCKYTVLIKNNVKKLQDNTIKNVIFTSSSLLVDNLMPYNHPGGSMEDIVYFYNKLPIAPNTDS